jgi:diguanylate cyclase (GGDEF)-like protein
MAAQPTAVSIRLKLSAAFAGVSLIIAALVIGAIYLQQKTSERAALLEAEHFATAIAYASTDNALNNPAYLQNYVDGLHALYGSDLSFVDINKRAVADANKDDRGKIFDEDPGNEVAQTIRDGRVRTFFEQNGQHPQGIRQIVVPLRVRQADRDSVIVGAAIIEYTQIYKQLLVTEQKALYLLAASGIGCVLLSMIFGLAIAARMAGRLKRLQDGVDVVAAGNYEAKVSVTSRDELGRLGGAFNTMAEALKSSRDQLEDRVASRTEDLTHANIGIRRLNRVYAVLSKINALILRVKDREALFDGACRIAVEHGQFSAASIAVVDRETLRVRPVASAGAAQGLLAALRPRDSLKNDEPEGPGAAALAIGQRKAVVINDVERDSRILRKKECVEHGVRSIAVLPIVVSNEAVGVLALFAGEPGFFDEQEMKLLSELAANIGFAVDHIEKQARLDYLAYYDALTGLANRTLFLERVAQHIRSAAGGGHKLAVFVMDLERFKNINDILGRSAGDSLLKQVAEWLMRDNGDANLVARVGADYFATVLPEVKPENSARSLEKSMRAFLEHPFRLNDAEFRIGAKVGIALFPNDGADAETLLRNAEAALKKAKAGGERYLFYTQAMNEHVAERLTLENQLRQALDKGEFVLHYQPKVNLATGELTGAEALIRWNDPRTGLVPPGRFIPILEETGLIFEVGRWALRQAIADYLRWRAAGLPAVRVAVNVSPLQLRNRGFVEEIGQAIGIDPHAAQGLELEITESLIMEDVKHSIASLRAIRAMGITMAIDDFGTGFSSLSYLAKLPVDTLKIDRSFVIDMTAGPQGLGLVSTIINLAHSLELTVVAEGVETEEQKRLLHLLSCDEMQGYLFSKPVPRDIFETRFLTSDSVRQRTETAPASRQKSLLVPNL